VARQHDAAVGVLSPASVHGLTLAAPWAMIVSGHLDDGVPAFEHRAEGDQVPRWSRLVPLSLMVALPTIGCGTPSDDPATESGARKTRPASSSTPSTPAASPSSPSPPSRSPRPDAPAFSVVGGRVEGPAQVRAKLGDVVTFTVTSDMADEVHVHTYDVTVPLKPGRPATVRVRVDIPGVFDVELEETHTPLTKLRVSP